MDIEVPRDREGSFEPQIIPNGKTHCLIYGAQNKQKLIDDHMVKLIIEGELS